MKSNETIKQELKELGSQLKDLSTEVPYKVPEGYFDGLAEQIISSVKAEIVIPASTEQTFKVVKMRPGPNLLKLSVAASIISLIGIFIFVLIRNNDASVVTNPISIKTETQLNDQLAKLEADEIIDYLNSHALFADHEDLEYFIDPNSLPEEGDYFDDEILNDLLNHGNKN
jgi:F420-0:gamma-glutamyl ligase-like protein